MTSVIIVSYNTCAQTLACLGSLTEHAPTGTEVVLVDNGSSDGTVSAVRAAFPRVVVDEAGQNLGFARGVNRGVAQSTGDQVLLLNPDAVVLPGAIQTLSAFAIEHPAYGLYGGRTLRPQGGLEPSSCWGAPTIWSLCCFALGLSTAFKGSQLFDPESLGHWPRDTIREVPIITGCLLLVSRKDWDRLGGLDETYFLYGEDAEFSIRAAREGFRPVIVPNAQIIHSVGGSTKMTAGERSGMKMGMVMAGKTTLLRQIWGRRRAAVGLMLLLMGVALRSAAERVLRRPGMWSQVWDRRRDWYAGYPAARQKIFGL